MAAETHDLDLSGLRLSAGEGRRLDLSVRVAGLQLGGERYTADPQPVPVRLEVSRMTGEGYALRLRFHAQLSGPCMRCLRGATPEVEVDVREVSQPGAGEELASPYVERETLNLSAWAHDAFALSAPQKVLCAEDCPGLCPVCAVDLREAGTEHTHERSPDPRWAKLRELRFD